jgi:NTP pyrophosphatase (non-canonical NTP hydrolase)
MLSVSPGITIKGFQEFVNKVYGLPNNRHYTMWDMFTHIQRFTMRGLKGIRKGDSKKTKTNLLIAFSWFMSLLNRLHLDIEEEVWKRFPYLCSYCGTCPCSCKEQRVEKRRKVPVNNSKRPATLKDFQEMFEKVYPSTKRTLEHAGVHLAEELGELSEAMLAYKGGHKDPDFENIMLEAADFFSCIVGVFNSLRIDIARELSTTFNNNCHVCHKAPCECSFKSVMGFKS